MPQFNKGKPKDVNIVCSSNFWTEHTRLCSSRDKIEEEVSLMCSSHRSIISEHGTLTNELKTLLEEDTLKDGLTLLGEGDSVLLPSKALNGSSFNDPFPICFVLAHARA